MLNEVHRFTESHKLNFALSGSSARKLRRAGVNLLAGRVAYRLPALTAQLRVREQTHPKLYFVDPGLVRALGGRQGPIQEAERGPLLEGFIAMHLAMVRDAFGDFEGLSFWAATEQPKTEVDFLLRRQERYVAVEARSGIKPRKDWFSGLRAIERLPGLERRIVVHLGHEARRTEDGIDLWPVDQFLEQLASHRLFGR